MPGKIYRNGVPYGGGSGGSAVSGVMSVKIGDNLYTPVEGMVELPETIDDTTSSTSTTYSSNKIDSEVAGEEIAASVSGASIAVTDSADANVQGLTVYGRSEVVEGEIVSIGDSGEVDAVTCGKNLIPSWTSGYLNTSDGKTAEANLYWTYTSDYIYVDDRSYALSANIVNRGCVFYYDANKDFISVSTGIMVSSKYYVITAKPNGAKYIRIGFNVSGASVQIDADSMPQYEVQLELGSTATSYEPYISSTASLTTGLPYCGIPVTSGETYTDEQGQKWLADTADVEGVVKRCGVVDLGDYEWTHAEYDGNVHKFFSNTSLPNVGIHLNGIDGICPNYQIYQGNQLNMPDKYITIANNTVSANAIIAIRDDNYTDATAFKTSVTGIKLVYPLDTTTTTQELTSAEKSALLNLKTFDSTTNVTITDDPFVDVGYLLNTANGKAIAQLSENLISMLHGGTPTFSFARAIYDAGDTVTATDGTTTLTSDTSGDYAFAIPNSGTWTFSDGTTTMTKSLTTYGETTKCNMVSLLPASDPSHIRAEIKAGHFNLGEDIGEGFKATNSNTFSLADDGSLITSPTGHIYYDLGDKDTPTTIYFVGKCPDNTTITRIFAAHDADSGGQSPGFYTESNKLINATYYGSNSPTNVSKTSMFALAMSLYLVTGARADYYVNGSFFTNKQPSYWGRYCYFSGTSTVAYTPTASTEYGDAMTISYIGIVQGREDSTTIETNLAAMMAAFGIS